MSSHCDRFADDFKVLASNQKELVSDLTAIDDWCDQNSMRVNISKFAVVNIRGIMSGSRQGKHMSCAVTQRDLGLKMNKSLSWNDDSLTRTRKALKTLFSLKRNFSKESILVVKMHYYVLRSANSSLLFSSMVSRHGIHNLERLRESSKKAVRSIFNSSAVDDFENKLRRLKLLPSSVYFETHDLLLLLKLLD